MALPAVAWEVKATGSDLNGGGFTAGGSGTNYSHQDAAQLSVTDGSAAGTTTLTSVTGGFTTAMVDNILQVSGGTLTAGFYRIVSRTDTNNVVLDRTPGTGSLSTVKVGGRFATIQKAQDAMTISDKIFAVGAFTTTATTTLSKTTLPVASRMQSRLIGGATSANDGGRATITLSTNSNLSAIQTTGDGWSIENFVIDGNNLSGSIGIDIVGTSFGMVNVTNCKIVNTKNLAIYGHANSWILIEDCEITSCTDGIYVGGQRVSVVRCFIHDNALVSYSPIHFLTSCDECHVAWNLVTNNTGCTYGIFSGGGTCRITNNTVYNSGAIGVTTSGNYYGPMIVRNNIIVNSAGYGMVGASGYPAQPWWDGNAYYNNTSGTRQYLDDTGSVNAINAVSPYTNVLDVILSAGPFTNAAGGDFTLNNTAGGGAACRGAGTPGPLLGVSQTGKIDMGCFQHADTGGPIGANFRGGFMNG